MVAISPPMAYICGNQYFKTMKTKHLLLALLACCAFVGCEEDNPKLRDDYKIYINGVDRVEGNKSANQERLTAHEVCLVDTVAMMLTAEGGGATLINFSLAIGNLDTINNRLIMTAGNISGVEDNSFFKENRKCFLQKNNEYSDTIAYIPTSQRLAIVDTLTTLFADGREKNIDKILEIFQTAFIFYPCTGEEYKELVAQGLD